ncbi:hypothetical protein Ddye_027197 [Dipteronia dyeriana]|uniref:Uncharacterized protein n=1 Tax=Dipteronia dyeriana TaxID=168575 RepID=A0AAD9TP28_9ROSI|nr:hypothetical protein Ddye_027197 [Dipteronia dyeriana]
MIKFRVAWWLKNYGVGSNEDLTILLLDIERWCVDRNAPKIKVFRPWSPPIDHDLVFNVDRSSRGFVDSNLAEVLVIHRSCVLISSIMYLVDRNITILSNSKTVVSWINGGGIGYLNYVNLLYDIKQLLSSTSIVSIDYTARSNKSLANILAKVGSDLQQERLEWGL